MRTLVPHLRARPVLVSGRGEVAAVAAGYGFQKIVTSDQLAAALPTALPFRGRRLSQDRIKLASVRIGDMHLRCQSQSALSRERHLDGLWRLK